MFNSIYKIATPRLLVASRSRPFSSSSKDAKLSYEWVVDGRVLTAAENDNVNEKYGDRDVVVFLHGLLGNGKNLRTPAKKLTERLPNLKAISLDVRGHGGSPSYQAPHTFQSCTRDVFETLHPLGLVGERSPIAICGHSLGGRIALQYSHDIQHSSYGIKPPHQTWILDSVPGTPDPSVHSVIKAISSIPLPVSSKSDLSKTLKEEYNFNKTIAMWMASNLKATTGGFEWIFDLDVANEFLSNFANQDFHQMIEKIAKEQEVHLVMAGKNKEWAPNVVERLQNIPRDPLDRFQMHKLEKAGHWVHVDDLETLLDLMVGALQK